MTGDLTIWTFDRVPPGPVGHVRDIRLRWAAEEAELPYAIATVPFDERGPEHLARQPFGQVPFLEDGGTCLFESGACLLHLAEKTPLLMPRDSAGRAETLQWLFAALNSLEMVSVPWWFIGLARPEENPLDGWLKQRLARLEAGLGTREWLAAGQFTIADIVMADALRLPAKLGALAPHAALTAYVGRACARPAFRKALADQQAHFAAGDAPPAGG
ncbi:glutathione S-transferase family protein [Oceanicella sp. SM1341]|uniref:glutathione S-transferase family protein n=1 Tax=Oceanicella sp. SM1341 TaxID=1548889 RepID=UPI000E4DB485|nr:glutathione S-transferase family protein [Oceanicella sp. SM1341]